MKRFTFCLLSLFILSLFLLCSPALATQEIADGAVPSQNTENLLSYYNYETGEESIIRIEEKNLNDIDPSNIYRDGNSLCVVEPAHLDKDEVGLNSRFLGKVRNANVYPYSLITLVRYDFDYYDSDGARIQYTTWSSGAMVYNNLVFTCAHAVYDDNGAYANTTRIYPMYNSENDPPINSGFLVTSRYVPYAYNSGSTLNFNYDWCVLKTSTTFTSSWFGYGYSNGITNKDVSSAGYPIDYSHTKCMYSTFGMMSSNSNYRFSSTLDCYGGQSGSAVYDSNLIIWGDMQSALNGYGYGCLVTSFVYNTIESMK